MYAGSELCLCAAWDVTLATFDAALGFADHVVNDLLGRFDVLADPVSECDRETTLGTHFYQRADLSHQPHSALHRLFRVFLHLEIMWNLALTRQLLAINCISGLTQTQDQMSRMLTFHPLSLSSS